MASKQPPLSFTDVAPSAVWRPTIQNCSLPWSKPPALAKLRFFNRYLMVGMDILHAWYLGCAPDLSSELDTSFVPA